MGSLVQRPHDRLLECWLGFALPYVVFVPVFYREAVQQRIRFPPVHMNAQLLQSTPNVVAAQGSFLAETAATVTSPSNLFRTESEVRATKRSRLFNRVQVVLHQYTTILCRRGSVSFVPCLLSFLFHPERRVIPSFVSTNVRA